MLNDVTMPGMPTTLAGPALGQDANGRPVLVGGRCTACQARFFPPAPVCPACMNEQILAEEMPREGALYAFSVVHAAPRRWHRPFTIGYVDLPNNVRVFSHLRGPGLQIGQTVTLDVAEIGTQPDGAPLRSFVFTAPAPASAHAAVGEAAAL